MRIGESDGNFKRIHKTNAKRLFRDGVPVYILAKNYRPSNNMWVSPVEIPQDQPFERFVNQYTYFNCTNETGRYPAFYLKD